VSTASNQAGPFALGIITRLQDSADAAIRRVAEFDLPTCQLTTDDPALYTQATADKVRAAAEKYQVTVTTHWAHAPGRRVWNFYEGPLTLGLVPPETRAVRLAALQQAAAFAEWIGAPSLTGHMGFIPEDPNDPRYPGTVDALTRLAHTCADHDIELWFETGQETPTTLLRTFDDIGTDNLGINLDPANLLLYGRANPLDAVDQFGALIKGVHAKDGEYPTTGRALGHEQPLGKGRVNFPVLIAKLKALDYQGTITIEREISGPQQAADIREAIELLNSLTGDQ
jgi:sugar phosphate isomerase/epimerase